MGTSLSWNANLSREVAAVAKHSLHDVDLRDDVWAHFWVFRFCKGNRKSYSLAVLTPARSSLVG
jgi:hypothetical protein